MNKNNDFDERFLTFAALITKLVSELPSGRVSTHIGDQLFRSATSVGAHLQEARAAESRADFVHKMQIALKEMRESQYWLALLKQSQLLPEAKDTALLSEAHQLVAILSKSVLTAKSRERSHLKPQTQHIKQQNF